jgi:hypothetical protein
LCAGCVKLGESSELPLAAVEPTPLPPDRIACQEILGTAFRSDNERNWFIENCSKWPLVKVADEGPGAPPPPASTEPPECAAIRGKPYESSQQRTWYLQNCNQGSRPPANQQAAANNQGNQPAQSQPQGDRTDCNAIRGTPYRSSNERNWYQQNCGGTASSPAQAGQQPQPAGGPDRADCNAIRGTAYRSDAERDWYNANCRGG